MKEYEGLSGDIGLIFQRARYNGNNNDKNIVRLIFYRHTFHLAAVTIYVFWFNFKREVSPSYKFKLKFRDASVCMIITRAVNACP